MPGIARAIRAFCLAARAADTAERAAVAASSLSFADAATDNDSREGAGETARSHRQSIGEGAG